jgi:uncharacterized protein (DUF2235 family)
MSKNIVICCDGTGNQLNEEYSNVVKLYMVAEKATANQVAFYDPGVGTLSDPNVLTPPSLRISKLFSLAFGFGLMQNVIEAYNYLMRYYEAGDKIFLFGFSRGAYTARVLAGLIYRVGLLQKGNENLIPYVIKAYNVSYKEENREITETFKQTYCLPVRIHFAGLWDTVTSIGLFNSRSLPSTTSNPGIDIIRHAVAIDERRAYYRQNLFHKAASDQDIQQVWFAGVHSDVGGSYAQPESGLAQIALQWMLAEATSKELKVDLEMVDRVVLDKPNNGKLGPDVSQPIHKSLKGGWKILEILPRRNRRDGSLFFPLGRPRSIDPGSMVHGSVFEKIKLGNYNPVNLPDKDSLVIV